MENIIFDLGNVLIMFDPVAYVNENIEENKRKKFLDIIFGSSEWLDLDRGTLSYSDAKKIFKSRLEDCDSEVDRLFLDNFYSMLKPITQNIALLSGLKEKYNLYVLSNIHKDSFEALSTKHEFFKNFDGWVISADYNTIKPEAKIYETLIEKYKLDPHKSLFIDDSEKNTVKAEEFGIKTIFLPDYTKLEGELKKLNIM